MLIDKIVGLPRALGRHVIEFVLMRSPAIALVRMASVVLNLLFVTLVTRLAGAITAGRFFTYYASLLIVSSLMRLGVEQYLMARLPGLSSKDKSDRIVGAISALVIVALLCLPVGVAIRLLTESTIFGESWLAFTCFWVGAGSLSVNWLLVGALRGYGRIVAPTIFETLVYLVLFIAGISIVGYFESPSLLQLDAIMVTSIGLSGLIAFAYQYRLVDRFTWPTTQLLRQSFAQVGEFWLATVLGVASAWLPIVLLGLLSTGDEVSIFTLSSRLATVLLFGLTILNARYAPEYARLSNSGFTSELIALYHRNTYAQLPFVVIAVGTLLIFAQYLIEFAGIQSSDAYPVLVVLTLGTFANAVCGPVVTASITTGHAYIVNLTLVTTLSISTFLVFVYRREMDSLTMARIVAVTVAVQNIAMYYWWRSRVARRCV